jgi:hypothetical protein
MTHSITVKNLKVAEFASEETLCFQATVYVDGKRAFLASNEGHGGPTNFDPLKFSKPEVARFRALVADLAKWAKTLPKGTAHLDVYDQCLESLVDDAVQKAQDEKRLRKLLKKGTIWTQANGQRAEIRAYRCSPSDPGFRAFVERDFPGAVILNDVPFERAMELYIASS